MARNLLETVMGAVVLVVAAGFLMFAFEKSAVESVDGYALSARFSDVSGIGPGSEVRIGGLKVGTVNALELDHESYQASIIMHIEKEVLIPKDSSAAIVSSGLIGDKFIKLEPGGSEEMLEAKGTIRFTQSSVSLEEMIGKFVFSGGGVSQSGNNVAPAPAEPEIEEKKNPFSLGL